MTHINNIYLVITGTNLLMLATGLLWPGGAFKSWSKATAPEVFWLLVITAVSWLMQGFSWEVRGLALTGLLVNGALYLRQRRQKAQ